MTPFVRDGEEALASLRKQGAYATAPTPGMVLPDINMPNKNGFEMLADIKADPRLRAVPVIILTVSDRQRTSPDRSSKVPARTFANLPP